eukprot:3810108-Prymnesium_polylepis.1
MKVEALSHHPAMEGATTVVAATAAALLRAITSARSRRANELGNQTSAPPLGSGAHQPRSQSNLPSRTLCRTAGNCHRWEESPCSRPIHQAS